MSQYDYIVVGAGPAGCAAAATLSFHGKTLILEQGGDTTDHPFSETRAGWPAIANSNAVNLVNTEDNIITAEAQLVGGGSSVNAAAFFKETPQYFETYWGTSMNYQKVEEAYQWVIDNLGVYPSESTIKMSQEYDAERFNVFKKLGFEGDINEFNIEAIRAATPTVQKPFSTFENLENSKRHSADYLIKNKYKESSNQQNLELHKNVKVLRVLFENGAAIGVEYKQGKKTHQTKINPGGEVFICCGALGTPRLLFQSGVGNPSDLHKIGVKPIVNQPLVGQNLHDKPVLAVIAFNKFLDDTHDPGFTTIGTAAFDNGVYFESTTGGQIAANFAVASLGLVAPNLRVTPVGLVPKLLYHLLEFLFFTNMEKNKLTEIGKIICRSQQFFSGVDLPKSRGYIKYTGKFGKKFKEEVAFNYFQHPEDLAALVGGVKTIRKQLSTIDKKWVANLGDSELLKFIDEIVDAFEKIPIIADADPWSLSERASDVVFSLPSIPKDDRKLEDWIKKHYVSGYHLAGSCEYNKVVDENFQLIDVNRKVVPNLRIVDASVIPMITPSNPQATVMMLGRYAAVKILSQK